MGIFGLAQVDQVVEAWRKLLEGVAAPARLVKRAEDERRVERQKEEEEEEMKRKVQEENKSVCSECVKEQSNNRDPHHVVILASTVSPDLGEMVENTGNKQEGGLLLPTSSEATLQEVGTTQTTTEVNFPLS